uniref:Uncharacterized protein n=1 Tax=Amphimedon queenslandica TaxID=400682 RepID=A0A1X7TIN0_AMPQE
LLLLQYLNQFDYLHHILELL